jgi:hypothetical protein
MKSVFFVSSRKFYYQVEKLLELFRKKGIKATTSGKWVETEKDTLTNQKSALLKSFKRIDQVDLVYVFSEGGYVGRTVCMEIAYAYSKNKELVSSYEIEELSARALISKIMSPEDLIEYCQ